MTTLETLNLYEVLLKHFKNEKEAKTVVEAIEQINDRKMKSWEEKLLVKEDKIDLIDRIHKAKIETIVWIVGACVLQSVLILLSRVFI